MWRHVGTGSLEESGLVVLADHFYHLAGVAPLRRIVSSFFTRNTAGD